MVSRRILAVAALAACFVIASPVAAQFGITVGGGKSDKDPHKSGGCIGPFCGGMDGKTIEKVFTPTERPPTDKPAKETPVPPPSPQGVNTEVCVHKFNDINANGQQDFGEPPLAGWVITVNSANFGPVTLGATGFGGGACFTTVFSAGVYTATETAQAGWFATTPGGQSQTFTLTPGQDVNLIFGNHQAVLNLPGVVCVTKYNDQNGSGTKNAGEPVLSGWSFTIRNGSGTVLDSGTTNAQGVYCSHPIVAGAATVQETLQSGWASTDPGGTLPSKPVTVVAGATVYLSFGNRQSSGNICVTKYNDLNGNGVQDSGEPPLANWIFTVRNSGNAIVDFGVTNALGVWCTGQNLGAGNYSVSETLQTGWTSTDPGGAIPSKPAALALNQTVQLSFGNWKPKGQLCVAKFNDANGDGIYQSGEAYLAGWQFNVTGPSGPIPLTTGTSGTACTPLSLLPGTYTVTEVTQSGWVNTAPGGTSPHRTVMVLAGPSTNNLMFGNKPLLPSKICIDKYNDLNGNGQFNSGEPRLPGWTFTVTNAAGNIVATGTTDAQGNYCAAGLAAGAYTVTETAQIWWVNTDPLGPPMVALPARKTVTLSGADVSINFGNTKAGRLCVHKYNDLNGNGQRDPGEPPLSGWVFNTQYDSWASSTEATVTTDATGTGCIYLPPSTHHLVWENLQTGWVSTDPVGVPVSGAPPWTYKGYTIVAGQTTDVSIGNHQLAAGHGMVCIAKYNDLDRNGTRDMADYLIAGWQFTIKNAQNATVGTIVSKTGGPACLDLPTGSYTAYEVAQLGWTNSDPAGANPHKAFTITNGHFVSFAFGNYQIPLP